MLTFIILQYYIANEEESQEISLTNAKWNVYSIVWNNYIYKSKFISKKNLYRFYI